MENKNSRKIIYEKSKELNVHKCNLADTLSQIYKELNTEKKQLRDQMFEAAKKWDKSGQEINQLKFDLLVARLDDLTELDSEVTKKINYMQNLLATITRE
jgi:hypothetical protein